jgi:hypothetical protein
VNHNVFAIEVCLRLDPAITLRSRLHELIAGHPSGTTPRQKREQLQSICALLADHENLFEKGCWDFFDDDDRARRDYDMWSNGMITEEGARGESSGIPGYGEDEIRYMTFTIALLVAADTPCARDLARLCTFPESQLWERATFVQILRGLSRVDFAGVRSDVLYLIPGADTWGLTAADLTESKFEYLRPIQ